MTAFSIVRIFKFFVVLGVLSATDSALRAEAPLLQGDNYWAVLASRQDLDQAIGAAEALGGSTVVHSVNGWYAAVSGPHHVLSGQGNTFLEGLRKEHGAPPDAFLSRGIGFDKVAWTRPKDEVQATLDYDGEHDAALEHGSFRLELTRKSVDKDAFVPVLTGFYKGKQAFREVLGDENANEKPSAQARLVQLDPGTVPDIVFTYYWQGAHCCTLTKIITLKHDNSWATLSLGALDGEGVELEDIEGHGFSYLVSVDQNFLYAFASYAESFAPIQIQRLKNGTLEDVTREPLLRSRVLQNIYRQEVIAKQQDEARNRGFLAGWVAGKLLVGDGPAAWRVMLDTYDREDNGFGVDKCMIDSPIEKCPDDKKAKLPFPEGLRQFLVEHGYISEPDQYFVPAATPIMPAPSTPTESNPAPSTPPGLQRCANEADTVRKLIYQQFLGREVRSDESYAEVDLSNSDITLEGDDTSIQKVTCAASYTFQPRSLIGRLAEEGNLRRAAVLTQLSRRSGGTVAGRVRYTVKPTANGNNWIELLP